jgi:hypothetical protein
MKSAPPPRRKWNITRWLLVFALLALAWSGWQAYAFRSAISQAKALGWKVEYTDPVETIRKNWKAVFKKETWTDGVTGVSMSASESLEQNLAIVYRLDPTFLQIAHAHKLRNLSTLQPLTRLQYLVLHGCTGLTNVDALVKVSALRSVRIVASKGLTNVDALKNLSALQAVQLNGCTGIKNVDGLMNLPALQRISLDGCTGLTNVDALENLSALHAVYLPGCTGLTNLDALINLPSLQELSLADCTGLTDVDALKNLSTLRAVDLRGCTGLPPESIAALKAALPNAKISGP